MVLSRSAFHHHVMRRTAPLPTAIYEGEHNHGESMIIDVAAHIHPARYLTAMQNAATGYLRKRIAMVDALRNLERRIRIMDQFNSYDYRQLLTVALPALHLMTSKESQAAVCHQVNEELQEIVMRHPDRFVGAFGELPYGDLSAAHREIEHIRALGIPGVQLFTSINHAPLDRPEILEVIEHAFGAGLCAFMHPVRGPQPPDYLGEDKSKFEIWSVFGWPYETTVAMARLVFSGVFDLQPDATLITHHLGGMVPFFGGRIRNLYDQFGSRTPNEDYGGMLARMPKHPADYFRMFFADTAINGSPRSIEAGVEFFGVDRVLFGTDTPFDKEGGGLNIRLAIRALEDTNLSPEAKEAIYCGNAKRILGLVDK
jgi:aminocarboxymuconate-semialdehyde decarboxylase